MREQATHHVLVGFPSLLQGEDLLIHNRVDVVSLNGPDHVVHHSLATNIDTTDSTNVAQGIEDVGHGVGVNATDKSNDADHTLELDALETLVEGTAASDLDNVVDTNVVRSQLAGHITPVGLSLVVDDMVGTQFLQFLRLLLGRGSSNDPCAGRFSKLVRYLRQPWCVLQALGMGILPAKRKC